MLNTYNAYQKWQKTDSISERIQLLQSLENELAAIQNRTPTTVFPEQYDSKSINGQYKSDKKNNHIEINQSLLESNNIEDFYQSINTTAHEGIHCLQDQIINKPEEFPHYSEQKKTILKENFQNNYFPPPKENSFNYDAEALNYLSQPCEMEARKYGNEIAKKVFENSDNNFSQINDNSIESVKTNIEGYALHKQNTDKQNQIQSELAQEFYLKKNIVFDNKEEANQEYINELENSFLSENNKIEEKNFKSVLFDTEEDKQTNLEQIKLSNQEENQNTFY